jgi:hypothetical protein
MGVVGRMTTTAHRHLVALNLPCSLAGTLSVLVEYHAHMRTGLTLHDIIIEALARGLSALVLEARSGPRRVLVNPDPQDVNVQ